ncbi:MAG: SDR family NAD(P)-dependent oxidoreductase [Acidimicrobiales bacterium]
MDGSMSFDFSARHVLVTGGSNGIGRAIAGAFAAAGADVTITGTRERNAYEDGFAQLTYRQLQVQDPDAIRRARRRRG